MADKVIQSLIYKLIADETELVKGVKASETEIRSLEKSLLDVDKRAQVWGATTNDLAQKQKILKDEINKLISQGVDPASTQITEMKAAYDKLGQELDDAGKETRELEERTAKLKQEQEAAAKAAEEHSAKIKKMADGMISAGKKMTIGLTVPIVAAGTAMVAAAMESEKATKLLENAIQAAGNQGKVSAKNLSDYAGQLQLISKYDDEATMSAFTLLEQMTALDEDGLKALMPSIQNLASALDMDLQSAASLVGKTIGSDTNALGRYGIEVDASASKSEKMAQVLQGLAKYQGAAATEAATFSGKMAILKNQIGDLAEQFGNELLPILSEVVSNLSGMVKQFSALTPEQKKAIIVTAGLAAAIGPLLIGIGNTIKMMSTLKVVMAAASGPAGWIALTIGALALLGVAVYNNTKYLYDYNAALEGTSKASAKVQLGILTTEYNKLSKELNTIKNQQKDAGEVALRGASGLQDQADALQKVVDQHKARIDVLQKEVDAQESLNLGVYKGIDPVKELTKAENSYSDALDIANKAIDENKAEIEKLGEQFDILANLKTSNSADEEARLKALAIIRSKIYALELEEIKKTEEAKRSESQATYDYIAQKTAEYRDAKLAEVAQDEAIRQKEIAAEKAKVDEVSGYVQAGIKAIGSFANAAQQDISESWDELAQSALELTATIAKSTQTQEGYIVAAIAEGLNLIVDLVDSAINYQENLEREYADTIAQVNSDMLSNRIKTLDEELKRTLAKIDAEERAALEAAGFIEDTEVQSLEKQLAEEADLEKKADLEKAIAKAKIEEEYQKKREKAEADADKARRKLEYDRAVWERKIMLAKIEIDKNKAISELGWFNNDKKAEVAQLYSDLSATVNAIPLPALARGGSFIVPPSFENDSFPITTAMAQSGERVTVETPEQQAGGRATFQIGAVIADPSGLRELERLLNKYGDIEYMRRG